LFVCVCRVSRGCRVVGVTKIYGIVEICDEIEALEGRLWDALSLRHFAHEYGAPLLTLKKM